MRASVGEGLRLARDRRDTYTACGTIYGYAIKSLVPRPSPLLTIRGELVAHGFCMRNERLAEKAQGTRLIESDSVVHKDKVCSDAGCVH